jgi:hypothetical protein
MVITIRALTRQIEAQVQVVSVSNAHVVTIVVLVLTNEVLEDFTNQCAEGATACQRRDRPVVESKDISFSPVRCTLPTNNFQNKEFTRGHSPDIPSAT